MRTKPEIKAPAIATCIFVAALITIILVKPQLTGNSVLTVTVMIPGVTYDYNCNLSLSREWNLISLPCSLTNNTVQIVFQNISSTYISVHSYDASNSSDPWKSYNPSLPTWVRQDLKEVDPRKGYWLRMKQNHSLNVSGSFTIPRSIALETGWNLVGYPTNLSKTPSQAFSSINSSISSVHAYNASLQGWKSFYTGISEDLNELQFIIPYMGYWINTSNMISWQITG